MFSLTTGDNISKIHILQTSEWSKLTNFNETVTFFVHYYTSCCNSFVQSVHFDGQNEYNQGSYCPIYKEENSNQGSAVIALTIQNVRNEDIGVYKISIIGEELALHYSFRLEINELVIINTKIIDEQTNKTVESRFWRPDNSYSIHCQLFSRFHNNLSFEGFQKRCLLSDSCKWMKVSDKLLLVSQSDDGLIKKAYISARTTKQPKQSKQSMSYRINFNGQLCIETDYYPSYVENGSAIISAYQMYYEGDTLQLHCYFDQDYFDFDKWMIGNESINSKMVDEHMNKFEIKKLNDPKMSYSSLTISNLTFKNDGNYSCILLSHIPAKALIYSLTVRIPLPPYFKNADDEYYKINYGENVDLNCSGYGDPPPMIKWVNQLNETVHIGTTYQFNQYYSDTFRCDIVNRYGTESKYFNVTVTDKIQQRIIPETISSTFDKRSISLLIVFIIIFLLGVLMISVSRIQQKVRRPYGLKSNALY